jgi:hypothetical protein
MSVGTVTILVPPLMENSFVTCSHSSDLLSLQVYPHHLSFIHIHNQFNTRPHEMHIFLVQISCVLRPEMMKLCKLHPAPSNCLVMHTGRE